MPNKVTGELRRMVLGALEAEGGQEYLQRQAKKSPRAFLSLIAKCMPKPQDSPVPFALNAQAAYSDQATAVIEAMAAGGLTPEQAQKIMGILVDRTRLAQIDELEDRLAAIETHLRKAA